MIWYELEPVGSQVSLTYWRETRGSRWSVFLNFGLFWSSFVILYFSGLYIKKSQQKQLLATLIVSRLYWRPLHDRSCHFQVRIPDFQSKWVTLNPLKETWMPAAKCVFVRCVTKNCSRLINIRELKIRWEESDRFSCSQRLLSCID